MPPLLVSLYLGDTGGGDFTSGFVTSIVKNTTRPMIKRSITPGTRNTDEMVMPVQHLATLRF
jgi:hypothetical protein